MEATASPLQPVSPTRLPWAAPRHWLLCVSVAVLALAAMAGGIAGPFLFDDVALIHGNHDVHSFAHWSKWLTGTLWDTNYDPSVASEMPRYWRPVVLASYALDWSWGQGSPLAFHMTNTIVHALNAGLLFHVLSGWVRRRWAAWLAAALFAVHPVQTESVAFIAGRTDSLCLLGLLLVVLGIRTRRAALAQGVAFQLFGVVLAFGSKEAAAVLPVLVCIEFWSEGREPLAWRALRAVFLHALPYLVISVLFVAAYMLSFRGEPVEGPSAFVRAALVAEAWGRYAALLVWPDDLTLGRALIHYDSNGVTWRADYAAVGAVIVLALLFVAWRCRHRAPTVSLGVLAYGAMLLPVSGVVWIGYAVLVSPRFLYLPMVGVCLAVAGALAAVERRQLAAGVACSILLLPCGIRAFARSCDYDDEQSFWRAEIEQNPDYPSAQQYFVTRELGAGRPRSALLLAHEWFQAGADAHGAEANRANLVLTILQATLALTPDIDRPTLTAIRDFARDVASGKAKHFAIPRLKLQLKLGGDPLLLKRLESAERRLSMVVAEAASRLGDDPGTLAAVERATLGCEKCWTLLGSAAIAAARAGELQRAETFAMDAQRFGPPNNADEVLEAVHIARNWNEQRTVRPSSLNEAGFYAALGAYGRAYQSAAGVIRDPPDDPSSRRALAELAFRAGDVHTARQLLEGRSVAVDVEAALAEFSTMVPWQDQPVDAETWIPGQAS